MGGFATYDKGGGVPGTTVYADNIDLSGLGSGRTNTITSDGQLIVGTTTANAAGNHVAILTLTAGAGVTITQAATTLTVGLTGGGAAVEHLTGDTGGSLNPSANNFNLFGGTVAAGTTPVAIAGAGSTLTTNIQRSQAIAATDSTRVGLAAFSNTDFSVDANGFVSIISGGFTWTDVTSATQALLAQNGYLTDRGGGVVYTLPASGSIGDEIIIVGKLGITTITPNANQQILMSSASGTVGATGTAVGTNVGDSITLICTTSGASTIWRAVSFVGNWTLS